MDMKQKTNQRCLLLITESAGNMTEDEEEKFFPHNFIYHSQSAEEDDNRWIKLDSSFE